MADDVSEKSLKSFLTSKVVEILDTLFLLPCTIQLMYLVATYNSKVQRYQREREEEMERLTETYRKAIKEKHDPRLFSQLLLILDPQNGYVFQALVVYLTR